MKKRVITGIAALVVLAVAWCTIPRPLVQDSYQLDYIEYQGETIANSSQTARPFRRNGALIPMQTA